MKLIVDLIYEGGISNMRYSISDTAEYGDMTRGPRIVTDETRAEMKQILYEIQTGEFAKEWIVENQTGRPIFNALRQQVREHPIEEVGSPAAVDDALDRRRQGQAARRLRRLSSELISGAELRKNLPGDWGSFGGSLGEFSSPMSLRAVCPCSSCAAPGVGGPRGGGRRGPPRPSGRSRRPCRSIPCRPCTRPSRWPARGTPPTTRRSGSTPGTGRSRWSSAPTRRTDALEVYDLTGHRLQRIPDKNGSVNNVDVRYGFPLDGEYVDIVVSGGGDVAVYKIDPFTRQLVDVTARTIKATQLGRGRVPLPQHLSGPFYVFAQAVHNGNVEQFELFDNGLGKIDARSVRGPWDVHPEPVKVEDGEIEACTVDDTHRRLLRRRAGRRRLALRRRADRLDRCQRTLVVSTYLVNDGHWCPTSRASP